MLRGVVVKAYNSYYYVQTGDKLTMCTLRGRFKKERFSLLVGDEVEYLPLDEGKGVIETILPRRSMLKRPMVANVDQVILTFAAASPDPSFVIIDRFLILAELSQLNAQICLNKIDLADAAEIGQIVDLYRKIGYSVLETSVKTGQGIDELRRQLYGRITVFAGPSGVGKSSLLNAVEPGLSLVTGEISIKIGRGKHTTRFAELLPLAGGGFVVDTPGFSFTEFADIVPTELARAFPEIAAAAPACKFNTCLHHKEPQCAVKQAVTDGCIAASRYASYLEVLSEVQENRKGY
ncbi:ribosome small subunit-dependent GTPase A [Thermosinus carboxydivorans Nor1]|uniref:Small ribosomal subunit biogenesis GTPase RsgA n=1 Tax=Thermosinus carboxydivorans Nor1 TaxID=401526 RepID=A1HMW6_9FIRM|nr:ribosome small subunit-dependent GTPase A [Thermosinus carboxydivorans]EAX48598.1 ribosome small subunit-dependent GTPase A [Thermosinus carboxydivorans Nor1]